ncbi:MAG: hypothetical protein Q8R50_13880 [Sediminibacterium sp.]|nr:hypothetical protein [Sediminibacterium sp.]
MIRNAVIALAFLFTTTAYSQGTAFLQDPVTNRSFNTDKYSGIKGTPFLQDKWIKGTATTPRGIYQQLELKFNVYDNTLFFNKEDEAFEFQDEITSFTLMPKPDDSATYLVYKKGITGADFSRNQYVQVLLEGPVGLYKLAIKQVSEMSEINAGIVKTFTNNSKYYISKNNQPRFIKINKSEILDSLSDQREKIQSYINEKKLSFRKDSDLVEVLKYYQSL